MATDIRLKEALPEITEALVGTYTECSRINHLGHQPLPNREAIVEIIADLLDVLYPGYGRRQNLHISNVEFHVGDVVDTQDVCPRIDPVRERRECPREPGLRRATRERADEVLP